MVMNDTCWVSVKNEIYVENTVDFDRRTRVKIRYKKEYAVVVV